MGGVVGGIVNTVGSMFGGNGGAGGTGFATPSNARIDDAASVDQANQLYGQNQNSLQQMQGFLQQVQAQNGLGNQSNVYNALQGVSQGTGPNPAQSMLQNATSQNIAQQAGLMAGQRGASQNVGLMARQIAQQGAGIQQQAIGQNAALQSQQQLNALNSMGGLATGMANQQATATQGLTQGYQSEQQNVLNSISQANAARAGVQTGINNANASMANTRMGQQGGVLGGILGGAGAALGLAGGGEVPQAGQYAPMDPNAPDVFDPANAAPQANAQSSPIVAAPQAPAVPAPSGHAAGAKAGPKSSVGKFIAGATSGSQSQMNGPQQAGNMIGKAIGTGLKNLFSSSKPSASAGASPYSQYEDSGFSADQMSTEHSRQDAQEAGGLPAPSPLDQNYGQANPTDSLGAVNDDMSMMAAAKGGKVPAMVSPGEVYLDRKAVKDVEKGKDPIKSGEKIKGKAKVKGDSYANDTVPKTLESGGIVLPKSVMEHPHPHWAAHKFVSDIMAKQGKLPARRKK